MNKYGSRKFIIAMMALIEAWWVLNDKLIGEETFKAIVIAAIGLYGVANVAQKVWAKEPAP